MQGPSIHIHSPHLPPLTPCCLPAWESRGSPESKSLEDIKGKSVTGRPESKSRVLSSLARPTGLPNPESGAREEGSACRVHKLAEQWSWVPVPHSDSGLPQSRVPLLGSPISCFSPGNFSARQAAYVDSSCWDSLVHHQLDESGRYQLKSLWPHKVT